MSLYVDVHRPAQTDIGKVLPDAIEKSSVEDGENSDAGSVDLLTSTDASNKEHRGDSDSNLSSMCAYYLDQRICSIEAWTAVVASFQVPWRVTGRMNTSVGWSRHTVAALAQSSRLPWFCCEHALLLGEAASLLPAANPTLHKTLILMQKTGEFSVQELASMLPPLLLHVEPCHRILDLCAAPGSKTLQLLDDMHRGVPFGDTPQGLLVANDVDPKRLRQLMQRTCRVPHAPIMYTCFAAQRFPTLFTATRGHHFTSWTKPSGREPAGQFKLKFDRVLCDVPCSSDGGIRKGIRKPWLASNALALHPKQLSILLRGLELLVPGGKLVYSTCSLNPIEDEAVVAAALTAGGRAGAYEVLHAGINFGQLPHCCGLDYWRVPRPDYSSRDAGSGDQFFEALADVPPLLRGGKIRATMFPPLGNSDDSAWVRSQMLKCVRVLPSSDGGGFFLAVFKKHESAIQSHKIDAEAQSDKASCAQDDLEQRECDKRKLSCKEPEEPASSEDGSELMAGCHVTVRCSGAPAVVIGPGAGVYHGLVKIRYPDKTTYHVPEEELQVAKPEFAGKPQSESSSRHGRPDGKRARKPGSRLLRHLSSSSPNIMAFANFFGLFDDPARALEAGVAEFPWSGLCFKTRDKYMLHLASAALLELRVPRQLRAAACAMPLIRRCTSADDQRRWGDVCPVRPCQEAATLLARCASRRCLRLRSDAFGFLVRDGLITRLDLSSLEASGQLRGLDSCCREGSDEIVPGAVVCVLWGAEVGDSNESEVAVICSIGAASLEIFAEQDIRLRLEAIALLN